MRNLKFYVGYQYHKDLQPVLQFCNASIADGERDIQTLLTKSKETAEQNPLALDFWQETNGGLREILEGMVNEVQQKAERDAARRLAHEAEKAKRVEDERRRTEELAAKQQRMKEKQALPPKPLGTVRPRGKFQAISRDPRYRINKWGEVVGPHGKTLVWTWDLLTAIPSVKVGGKKCSILSLLQDAGFQPRKERPPKPKPAPVANDWSELAAEDPEANPPKGYNSWAEARGEDPETYGIPE